jgi:O-acetyl-ADP-ribose deacetylase (regulator of RNase III)
MGAITAIKGDITQQAVDAIVNAANSSLMGGGGVDGAIHKAGGPAILRECQRIRQMEYPDGMPTGDAVLTTAGNMKARHVIHTVGPVWADLKPGDASDYLTKCYVSCLELARKHGIRTVAFPAISTGAYGFPKREAAEIAVRTAWVNRREFHEIRFVLFSDEDLGIYRGEIQRWKSGP